MQESGQPIRTEEDVILEVERAVDTKMETIQKNMTTAKDWDRPYDKTFAPGVAPWVVVRGHYKGKPVRYPKIDWGEELYWIEQSRRNQLQKIINTTDDCFSKCIVNLSKPSLTFGEKRCMKRCVTNITTAQKIVAAESLRRSPVIASHWSDPTNKWP